LAAMPTRRRTDQIRNNTLLRTRAAQRTDRLASTASLNAPSVSVLLSESCLIDIDAPSWLKLKIPANAPARGERAGAGVAWDARYVGETLARNDRSQSMCLAYFIECFSSVSSPPFAAACPLARGQPNLKRDVVV